MFFIKSIKANHETLICRFIDGPEPTYQKVVSGFKRFIHREPFRLHYNNGLLPEVEVIEVLLMMLSRIFE